MAKELPYRLPRPAAQPTDTYSRPNIPGPLAPQDIPRPLAASTQVPDALQRLITPLMRFGQKLVETEEIQIDTEEKIRSDKMSIDEARDELQKLARQSEKDGSLAAGSNPYRLKVAMEYAAERVMRDGYATILDEATSKYSNPMNQESPERFARDSYQNLEIGGYFAQARAAELYDSMTVNWLSRVRQQRSAKMIVQNQKDLDSAVYSAFSDHWENPSATSFEDLEAQINQASDVYRGLTGGPGRDRVAAKLAVFMDTMIQRALSEGDEADIGRLRGIMLAIEEDSTGTLQFGEDQIEVLDAIENKLTFAEKKINNIDFDDGLKQAGRELNNLIASGDHTLDPARNGAFATVVEDRLNELGVPQDSIATFMTENFSDRVQAVIDDDGRSLDDALLPGYVNKYMIGDITAPAAMAAIAASDAGDATKNRSIAQVEAARSQRASERRDITNSGGIPLAAAQNEAEAVGEVITDALGLEVGAQFAALAVDDLNEVARAAYKRDATGTQDEQSAAVEAAVTARAKEWRSVRIDGGRDFNITLAREHGLPEEAVQFMAKVSRQLAAEGIGVVPDAPPATEPADIDMRHGWFWRRAMLDNIDDSLDLHAEGLMDASVEGQKNRDRVSELNAEARADSLEFKQTGWLESLSRWRVEAAWGPGLGLRDWGLTENGIRPTVENRYTESIAGRLNDQWLQAVRLNGLSRDEMTSGTVGPVVLSNFPETQDPTKTLMVIPDTWIEDLESIADVNTSSMPQESLIEQLPDNPIITQYQAYVEMVGENDAVGLNDFITAQIHNVGRVTLPPLSPDLIKSLNE